MTIDYFKRLARIAADMDQAQFSPIAEIGYDAFADALVWSDEYPRGITASVPEFDCVKLVLRYRTTVLLGKPDDFFKPYWDRAKELFPNWAGFHPSRLKATDELVRLYEDYSAEALRGLERWEEEISSPKTSSEGDGSD